MLRPILNSHKNVKLTDSRGVWRRAWGLWRKMVHILCDGCDGWWRKMVLTVHQIFIHIYIYIWGVRWVMCMDRSVREGVCSRAYILKGFQIFYLVGCFVMSRLWLLIFRGDKEAIFFMFCCRQVLVLVSPRWL